MVLPLLFPRDRVERTLRDSNQRQRGVMGRSQCYQSERRSRGDWGNSYFDRGDHGIRGIRWACNRRNPWDRGQPIEQPTGLTEPERSLAERPTRTFTQQQPVEPPWEGPSKTSTGVDPEGNDLNRTPSEDNALERDAAGQTSSNSGPKAGSSITAALHRTRNRATTPSEASAGDLERHRSGDDDREGPRPNPALDPRWEAAIRARGTGTSIIRGDPRTGAIATTTGGTTGSAE